nr:Phospholipase C [Ipomoea batatas]
MYSIVLKKPEAICWYSGSFEAKRAAGDVTTTRCYRIIPHRDTSSCDNKAKYTTLNEYFLASPALNHAPPSGKVFAYKSSPEASAFHTPRVSLSSPDKHAVTAGGFFSPRLSFSTAERLMKIEETDGEKKEASPSRSAMMSRSRSSSWRFKKKVTFKLPENADVVVFCTPHDSFEDP